MTDKPVSHNPLPNKERIKLPRQRVPEQEPCVRAHNFLEVNLGFPAEQARQESLDPQTAQVLQRVSTGPRELPRTVHISLWSIVGTIPYGRS